MTMSPNTRTNDLKPGSNPLGGKDAGGRTFGSLIAAAFILVVSFIAGRFYE